MSNGLTYYLIPLGFIVGGLLLGKILEVILHSIFKKTIQRNPLSFLSRSIKPLSNLLFFWIILLGIYAGLTYMDYSVYWMSIFNRIITILFIFSATITATRIIGLGIAQFFDNKGIPSASLLVNLTKFAVFFIGILILLQAMNISITPLITALGVGGLALALAMQDTLSNLIAGIQIIASKQLAKDDVVQLASGEMGIVEDISWRNTTLKVLGTNLVIIPNSKLSQTIITNFNYPTLATGFKIPIGVSYNSDLEKVEKVTLEVVKEMMENFDGFADDFEPVVRFNTFNDSSIDFNLILRSKDWASQFTITHELIKRLQKRYKTEGIDIPFPIRTVHLKKD